MANKTNAYFKWRKAFIRDDRLSSTTKLVLHALHVYMKVDTLEAFPSRATLAEDTGLNERSISRLTKKAEALGWIKKFRAKQKGNQFFNNIYKGTYPNHGYVCTLRGDSNVQSRGLKDTQGVTQSPTNYPSNYLYNSSIKKEEYLRKIKEMLNMPLS